MNPNAKVVVLTSLGSENDIEECLRAGAASYIQKPLDAEIVHRTLEQLIAE